MSEADDKIKEEGQAAGAPDGAAAADAGQQTTEIAETPDTRISALEAERDDIRDRMLRIAADFENYKKRVRKEQLDAVSRAREEVLRELLEVIDNLERAISAATEPSDPVLKGVNLVVRQFQSKLERYDVKAFESTGQPFDPRRHEAISQVPTADAAPGTVVREHQKGYMVGDRLLRPAVVGVACAPAPKEPPNDETKDGQPQADQGEPAADGESGTP